MKIEIYEASVIISITAAAAASSICFIYRRRHKHLEYLFIYPLSSIIESFSMDLSYLNIPMINSNLPIVINWFIMSFLIVEFFTLTHVLLKYSPPNYIFKIPILIIYSLAHLVFFFISQYWSQDVERFYIVQSSLILAPALIFMFSMFNDEKIHDLKNYPPFWISLGVILYSLCTFPITLAKDIFFTPMGLMKNLDLYSINNICYALLFILLTKSVLCKTQTQFLKP